MFLTWTATPEFSAAFSSFQVKNTPQTGSPNAKEPIPGRPTISAEGMVDELTLVTPGAGYPNNAVPQTNVTSTLQKEVDITNQEGFDIQTEGGSNLIYDANATGDSKGQGLTVIIGDQRTTKNGITTVTVNDTGTGYALGDIVSISGFRTVNDVPGEPALFEVSKVKTESPVSGSVPITIQNNYLVLYGS